MKGFYKFIFLMMLITAVSSRQEMNAVPAYPNPIEFRQPDGSIINIIMRGDEKVRWAQTLDGYTILFNKEGAYEYAIINEKGDLVPSGIIVSSNQKRTQTEISLLSKQEKGLFFSKEQVSIMKQIWDIKNQESKNAFPTTGDRKLICILVGFKDKDFTKTQDDFNNLFNQVGYSAGGATGSVKDYYLENSYQQFNLTVDIAGPYTISQNMSYYGANDEDGSDKKPQEMVTEAVYKANAMVDFSQYDNDSDGYVDGLYVIYAGYGEEAGGGADAIWAHAWAISPLYCDGKYVSRYSCSAELRGNSGTNITAIGVICHEFGHVLGAPDYYDTNYQTGGKYEGTGDWDMMAGGSWNNGGVTPAHHNGFTKTMIYQWAEVNMLEQDESVVLLNTIDDNSSYYRFDTQTSNEYFLIEYREKQGFDSAIPGSGMLIYHVHKGVMSAMNSNSINNTHPQKMYPVSANAQSDPTSSASSYGNINSSTCVWTGLNGSTTFSDETIPSTKSWDGEVSKKALLNIHRDADAKTVTFDFVIVFTDPEDFVAVPVSGNQIDISWTVPEGQEVLLAYSETGEFGVPVEGTDYAAGEMIPDGGIVLFQGAENDFSHIDLKSSSKYHYKIWMKLNDGNWSEGVETDATTLVHVVDSFPWVDSFEGEVAEFSHWWLQENVDEGSQEWMVVAENETNPSQAYDGDYFALLKKVDREEFTTRLISPEFDFLSLVSAELSFWYFLEENTEVQDELRVYFKTTIDDEWALIENAEYTASVAEWTKVTLELPEPLTATYYLAFEGVAKGGHGVCIDSVAVSGELKTLYSLSLTIEGNGTVSIDDTDYTEPITVYEGQELNLTASPDFGWNFDSWSGDLEETENPLSITVEGDLSLVATFLEKLKYSLEISIEGDGVVEIDGEVYAEPLELYEGTEVSIEALPDEGWRFDGWTGDISGSTNPQTHTITSNTSVSATFSKTTDVDFEPASLPVAYPNPFNGTLSFSNLKGASVITITNIIGQKVYQRRLNGEEATQISTDTFAKGIYLISIANSNGERRVLKVIKQ
ncbi:MAG TPA: M6 family metalloprotease domain-containing protein [Tenuifilaceae bacterium]|nr:M6 family metalloprotease domain-containing protein [Tenuifilaceae bacterium]HPJ47196.1 M6 family metalloprotease domain-containing protein [Tenuifilaceae bacterium]HPQ35903.1 M6 family metalloprotease domain-containing protein [Tenuifilaceae bacterium]